MEYILLTGGAGYIGSHACAEFLSIGKSIVVVDNLSNSNSDNLARLNGFGTGKLIFIRGDVQDRMTLTKIFETYNIKSVIHFAGLKAVGESVQNPILYYNNNIGCTLSLLEICNKFNCKNIVFSSSATVYGEPASVPIKEESELKPTNPYGTSKLIIENILKELAETDKDWSIAILRYFNPVGAHPSGLIGEEPRGIPNNLMPFLAKVAAGELSNLNVFGNNYDTSDGTGVRDYIHVTDLADGHLCALEYVEENMGIITFNLGTGNGYSVLEIIKAFERASGQRINYKIASPREGDIATCFSDPSKAKNLLNWEASRSLDSMCEDHWNWQKKMSKK